MSKSIYFASDFHLGLDIIGSSREREQRIVDWLDSILENADELYLLGDLFDYWFEYKMVVPKGFVRLLAKLGEFTRKGIPVHIFIGNHDMWMFDYLEDELDVIIYREPLACILQGKKMLLGHGDGLGPADHGYKFIKKVFSSKINQWLFARIHPNLGVRLMKYISQKPRKNYTEEKYLGAKKEWLQQYCEKKLKTTPFDYFIFGHRHLPLDITLSNQQARYINTGDWLSYNSFAELKDGQLTLHYYQASSEV